MNFPEYMLSHNPGHPFHSRTSCTRDLVELEEEKITVELNGVDWSKLIIINCTFKWWI